MPSTLHIVVASATISASILTATRYRRPLNESVGQKEYFESPRETREAVESEYVISEGFKAEIQRAIDAAHHQLIGYGAAAADRLIFLVVRPDFNFHGDDELLALTRSQNHGGLRVILYLP